MKRKWIVALIAAALFCLPAAADAKYRGDSDQSILNQNTLEFLFHPQGLSLQVGYTRVMLAPLLPLSNMRTNTSGDDNYQFTWDDNVWNSISRSLGNAGYSDPTYMNIPALEVGLSLGKAWVQILVSPWWNAHQDCFFLQGTSGVWIGTDPDWPLIAKGHIYFYGYSLSFSKPAELQQALSSSGIVPPITNTRDSIADVTQSAIMNYGLGVVSAGTGLKAELGFQIEKMFIFTASVYGEMGALLPAAITADWGFELHMEAGLPFLRAFIDVRPSKWLFDVSYYTFGVNMLF